jgi:hypothetical protein
VSANECRDLREFRVWIRHPAIRTLRVGVIKRDLRFGCGKRGDRRRGFPHELIDFARETPELIGIAVVQVHGIARLIAVMLAEWEIATVPHIAINAAAVVLNYDALTRVTAHLRIPGGHRFFSAECERRPAVALIGSGFTWKFAHPAYP